MKICEKKELVLDHLKQPVVSMKVAGLRKSRLKQEDGVHCFTQAQDHRPVYYQSAVTARNSIHGFL